MTLDREVVTYDGLPVSAGGAHGLRSQSPRKAYEQVHSFVAAAALPQTDPTLTFQLWAGGAAGASERLASFAAEQLGGPQRRQRTHTQWRVRADTVDAVLDELNAAGADAVTEHGHPLASLAWSAPVALLDPATGAPYAGIDADTFNAFEVDGYGRVLGASGIRATFGTTRSSLSLWLNFPGDDGLHAAARHVQAQLPIRLSAQHWRRWRPTRDGSSYRSTKIPSPAGA